MISKKFSRLLLSSTAVVLFVLSLTISVQAIFKNKIKSENYVTASFSKNGECGQIITFEENDFTSKTTAGAAFNGIVIAELPSEDEGILLLGDREVLKYDGVSAEQIASLRFIPSTGEETVGRISFIPVFSNTSGGFEQSTITINLSDQTNDIPIAEDLTFETYKNMSICGKFKATDIDGTKLIYKIIDSPQYADIEIEDDGFRYTPHKDKCGKDTFSYVATDEKGNTSDLARVTVIINRRSERTAITYSDMDTSVSHFAAVRLAEMGVMTGERIGGSFFFNPDKEVSRGEFIAMTVLAAEISTPAVSINTGLYDDGEIPKWVKPYVSAGLNAGIISGIRTSDGNYVFNADREITPLEATVILSNVIGSDNAFISGYEEYEDVPVWANNAVSALKAANIIDTASISSASITREQAAQMIYNTIQFLSDCKNKC